MKKGTIYTIVLLIFFQLPALLPGQGPGEEGGWFYVKGKRFFVKGIGYEANARPGQVPWVYAFEPDKLQLDMQRIRDAGFNTIRTWGALSKDQLDIVQSSGLKMIFGIWLDPGGDFADPDFINSSIDYVNNILAYSKDYSCIIAYLIMNEPTPEHIYSVGAKKTVNFWKTIIGHIQSQHPGVPVSVSLTETTDFVRTDNFGFNAYNLYIYNPATMRFSNGYTSEVSYLQKNRTQQPLIVTEFGLSVSPTTPDPPFGYGGNTLQEQWQGDLMMYRAAIDGGAAGACVFQYHDGWFKAGDEFTHDNNPEEWFGLFFFDNDNMDGDPRPAWDSLRVYNRAIISAPQNGAVYLTDIPVELFTTNDVASFALSLNGSSFATYPVNDAYFSSFIHIDPDSGLKDVRALFRFYDSNAMQIKLEEVTFLVSENKVELPRISISFSPKDLHPGNVQNAIYEITPATPFHIENDEMMVAFHPHIGWEMGEWSRIPVNFSNGVFNHTTAYNIPGNTLVCTYGAGIVISYGNFRKRITARKTLFYGDWADDIASPELVTAVEDPGSFAPDVFSLQQNYPNPFNPSTKIEYRLQHAGHVMLNIYNVLGQVIKKEIDKFQMAGKHVLFFDGSNLSSGLYFYVLDFNGRKEMKKMILLH